MRRTQQVFFQLPSSDRREPSASALLALLIGCAGLFGTGVGCDSTPKVAETKPAVVDDKGEAVDLAPWLRRPLTRPAATKSELAKNDPRLGRDPAVDRSATPLGMDLLRAAADGTLDEASMSGEKRTEWSSKGETTSDPMGLGLESIAREQARAEEVGAAKSSPSPALEANTVAANAWSIVLANAKGEGAEAQARGMLAQVQSVGLSEAYVERRGSAWVVATGAFAAPSSPEALAAVARVREIEVEGQRPFAGAVISPPLGEAQGTRPEWDLRNAKAINGKRAVFTLQIAVYQTGEAKGQDAAALAEIRKTAEQAVVELRREGEEAFYFHGPIRSSVTVGLFDDKDYIYQKTVGDMVMVTAPVETAKVSDMRKKYPYNLVNGAQYLVRQPGKEKAYPQASLIVPVPQ